MRESLQSNQLHFNIIGLGNNISTFSLLALTMLSIQEASAAECNSNDDAKNNNNQDSKTCANKQHSKNHDPPASNTKSSIPFRLPMPFP
jgi:hypothetical protein